jgi:hypothetical protein
MEIFFILKKKSLKERWKFPKLTKVGFLDKLIFMFRWIHRWCGNLRVHRRFLDGISIFEIAIWVLRTKYRIVGNLIGAVPQFQQQNLFSGPPLLLMPEEVTLLSIIG